MEFDINNKKKAEELPPMYYQMMELSHGVSKQIRSTLHQTPSYHVLHFYKPLTSCITYPKQKPIDER